MWLPRPLYESIPYACFGVGAALFGVACYVDHGPRGLAFACGGLFVTVGLILWMKRRDYRSAQADYNPRALDE